MPAFWHGSEDAILAGLEPRRRLRRILYRAAAGLVGVAFVMYRISLLRDGLFIGAGALVIAEPLLWRLVPLEVRDAYRRARTQIATVRAQSGSLVEIHSFDPELGATGRPRPADALEAGSPGDAVTVRPSERTAFVTDALQPGESTRLATWWRYARIAWDGSRLSVVDPHIHTTPLPLFRDDGEPDHVAEIVWSSVSRSDGPGTIRYALDHDRILFLDTRGHQYAAMPALGFRPEQVRSLAEAAGLAYHLYRIGVGSYGRRSLESVLFPPRPDTLIVTIR